MHQIERPPSLPSKSRWRVASVVVPAARSTAEPRMRQRHTSLPFLLVAALSSGAACAGTATLPPAVPAPPAVQPVERFSLEPSAAATRSAERTVLRGRELGTMWTFENPPLEYWKREYGFSPSPEWLDRVRLSSVRFGEICSASFVSPEGLVMTNHHCARECVEQVTKAGEDLVVHGFAAKAREEERLCPDLYLDQLVGIEDVTRRVRSATSGAASASATTAAIERVTQDIESQCTTRTGNTCQLVTLFQGGQYQLYRYKRYQPVKLVFAPELQAGYFGGDADNFTYPRYALDVSFVRAYEADGRTPAATPMYFPWNADGAAEGDPVFVTGNPGSTSRLVTVSQVMYERAYRHPVNIQLLSGQRDLLTAYAKTNPGVESETRQDLFEIENSLKAYRGELEGLRDSTLIGIKVRWEREFREKIAADPAAEAEFGDVWDRIDEIQQRKLDVSPPLNAANLQLGGSPWLAFSAQLVQWARQLSMPDSERAPQYSAANRRQIEAALQAPSPIDPWLASLMLRFHLEMVHTWVDPDHELYGLVFERGESVDDAVKRLTASSRVLDPAFRKSLIAAGPAAVLESEDPLIVFARKAAAIQPDLAAEWREIQADETVQRQRLGRALFAAYGTNFPPDATFTLRISDGRVERYAYNGTFAPPFTTFAGMYARSAEFSNQMPWSLPASFAAAVDRVRMQTRLDFVATTDITGGNSGSPMIDRDGRVIGLAFDGNIEQLPNEFVFRTETGGRTVAVHSAAIIEALRNIYEADALLRELLGARSGTGGGIQ
jgi:Peptidase S46